MMGDVMSVGAAGRVSWGKAGWLAGAALCACAAWMLWPGQPDMLADEGERRAAARPAGQSADKSWREVDILRVELAQIRLDLKKERRLVKQLLRELQDASRQIDHLSKSAERLRTALRQGDHGVAEGLAPQRGRYAPMPTAAWRTTASQDTFGAVTRDSRHRSAVRPQARVSSYASRQNGQQLRSRERRHGDAEVGPVSPDHRSRLAPRAVAAPRPVISGYGAAEPRGRSGPD